MIELTEGKADAYDDSPWTREEIQAQAWETANRTGWQGEDDDPAAEAPGAGTTWCSPNS